MTPNIQQTQDLVRAIICSFIDHPAFLEIAYEEQPAAVFWSIKSHAHDHGKITGKEGSHFRALKILIDEMGFISGKNFILQRYREPDAAGPRALLAKATTRNYDASDARNLLVQILKAIGIGPFTLAPTSVLSAQHPSDRESYTFTITTEEITDYTAMTVPLEGSKDTMTTIGAIGTIFRAFGNTHGVKFAVEVRAKSATS